MNQDRGAEPVTGADSAPADPEVTVVGATTRAPSGPAPDTPPGHSGNALPPGTRLHEFELQHVIGEGGFGIVYLARDLQLERVVAVKEYMPSALAARAPDRSVSLRSPRHRETFDLGLRSFVNEARLLASFDHPSLVKVFRFWEQNDTAYMVMPFYEGPTLKAQLRRMGVPPDETWLKARLEPLLDALHVIHEDHCYHRDIAPDNILLLGPQLRPLLLDFGAARRVIGDATQVLTIILKPGFAPVEQYAEVNSMKQGPWTDVYALCAVLYAAIAGRTPPASVGRMMHDELVPISELGRGRYSGPFLAAIDAGLAIRPEHRTASIDALRRALWAAPSEYAAPSDDDATIIRPPRHSAPDSEQTVAAQAPIRRPAAAAPAPRRPEVPPVIPTPTAGSVRRGTIVIMSAVVLVVALGGIWLGTRHTTSATAPLDAKPSAQRAPEPPPAPSAAAARPDKTLPTPAPVPVPARAAFTLPAVLDEVVRHASPTMTVSVTPEKEFVTIGRDVIKLTVRSAEAGYLYVFLVGTGAPSMQLIFPNEGDKNNKVLPGQVVNVPRSRQAGVVIDFPVGGPAGTDQLVAMVSREPRDFAALGPRTLQGIVDLDVSLLRRLWDAPPIVETPFAGSVRCTAATPCSTEYGAAMTRIVESDAVR